MPLQKETITFNFTAGLDTIDDPNQLPLGKFVALNNAVFIKTNSGEVGALKKRNGFSQLPATLSTISYIANYGETILGFGPGSAQQYSPTAGAWFNQGYYQPMTLGTKSLIRNSFSQSQQDSTIAANNIGCVAYSLGDSNGTYKYAIFDSATGQIVSGPTILPVISSTTYAIGQPKTFSLGSSFFIIYGTTSSGNATNSILATKVSVSSPFASSTQLIAPTAFVSNYTNSNASYVSSGSLVVTTNTFYGTLFDGVVASSNIMLSYVTAKIGASGYNIVGSKITPTGTVSSATIAIGSYSCSAISVCFDTQTSTVFTTVGSATSITYLGTNYNFAQSFAPTSAVVSSFSTNYVNTSGLDGTKIFGVSNIGSIALSGTMFSFYDVATFYTSIFGSYRSDNLILRPVTSVGVVGSESMTGPGLGLASKPFIFKNGVYVFGTNQDNYQPSYFLINSSGGVLSQFSYGNAGPFYSFGVPSVFVDGTSATISYLKQDLLVPQNTGIVSSNTSVLLPPSPFYSQVGINYGNFVFTTSSITAIQTGNTVAVSGGFLWTYDGVTPFENNFFLFPAGPQISVAKVGSGDTIATNMVAQRYQYQATFESMDNQGNIYRSSLGIGNSPSAPSGVGSMFANISVSTPRISYRNFQNPMSVALYRWSQAQPIFYKLGSFIYDGNHFTGGISNNLTYVGTANASDAAGNTLIGVNSKFDSVTFTDTTGDNQITGNEIIYTNGNVVEDSPSPSFISMDVWDERLWGISAEDGTIWYSKTLVSNTPVEMNGNFSLYVPPNQTSQGTSQKPLCLAPLDEKQIIFCKSSILFISGSGPDATGAGSQYSDPVQIPSQVGCSNPRSIVQTPFGLMFQSDNGIWLLGRDLSVKFIGKEVEAYNSIPVTSAVCVPGTSEVRLSLNNGTRLVYDLSAEQWGTFSGVTIQSGAIIQGQDTILSSTGQLYQEAQNTYLDGTTPVTMSFTTGWINLASSLQGYQRAYWMDILGTFSSPHTYTIGIAYDYNPTIVQTATINPYNVVGSGSAVEQWQVFFKYDQCQSFQLTFNEISSGTAGAGLTVSGISLTYGKKKTYAGNIPTKNRTG